MKANLHVHTNHSDGTKTVSEINELALKNNIDVIGITDHDTLNAVYDIVKLDTTVKFILGVEVSCKYKGETIHILGYFKDIPDKKLIDYFKINEEKRLNRCLKIIDNLEKYYGIKIDYEDTFYYSFGSLRCIDWLRFLYQQFRQGRNHLLQFRDR